MSGFNETDVGRAVQELVRSLLAEVHTCMPGRIDAYDSVHAKATVTPLLRRPFQNGENVQYEPILDVPVMFPANGSASILFPVSVGDTVLLVFSERSLENWLPAGGIANTSLNQTHSLSDAIAIPGLFPLNHSSGAPNNTDLQVTLGSQKITIKANGDIEIGASLLQSLMTKAAMDAFNLHTHLVTIATLGAPTPSAPPTVPMVELTHCTTKVKAQ